MELYTMGKKVMTKNIVVAGGGAAGWITALYLKKLYGSFNITLIESTSIGILGAGEGSDPLLTNFLNLVDIELDDIVKNCDATIKTGIKFTNWNNDGKFYYHPFMVKYATQLGMDDLQLKTSSLIISSIFKNKNFSDINFIEKISEESRVPFISKNNKYTNLKESYEILSDYAIHFNASKFANRLKQIGLDRGINLIDEIITEVDLDIANNVESLTLENNKKVFCDFVFDCSGLNRLIIGKIFNSKWKSYKDFLPVDSAVPFFLKPTEEIPPYTEAISMKYGWMWKIPLQTRTGCGYAYDSSLISENDAIKEIEDYLGYEPEYPRKDKGGFSFNAGCYEESWINNCIAVGLASSFIEPLEATSISGTLILLKRLLENPEWLFENNNEIKNSFNKFVFDFSNHVSEFIYFHYLGERNDTDFWKKFSYENAPEKLKEKMSLWNERFPNTDDSTVYRLYNSWLLVGLGVNAINKDIADRYIEHSEKYKQGLIAYNYFVSLQNQMVPKCVDHRQFLEGLK
jgi:tryptophan 7-halogenase